MTVNYRYEKESSNFRELNVNTRKITPCITSRVKLYTDYDMLYKLLSYCQ